MAISRLRERDVVSGMAVFVAVVEGGSLAAAARATGLTASAVSKLVTRLERDFGASLIRRTTRRMSVTDAGRIYYERACAVLESLRAVEQEMTSHGGTPRGLLRVSAPQLLGQTRVLPILLRFLEATPAVTLDFEATDREVDLVASRIDIAVRITSQPPTELVARSVGVIRFVLCASPAYLRAQRAPRDAGDLKDHACLMLGGPDAGDHWTLRTKTAESIRVPPRARLNTTLAVHEAARAGLGIADLPHYLVAEDLRKRRLVPILEGLERPERGVYVMYAAGPLVALRVREASKMLVAELRKALA